MSSAALRDGYHVGQGAASAREADRSRHGGEIEHGYARSMLRRICVSPACQYPQLPCDHRVRQRALIRRRHIHAGARRYARSSVRSRRPAVPQRRARAPWLEGGRFRRRSAVHRIRAGAGIMQRRRAARVRGGHGAHRRRPGGAQLAVAVGAADVFLPHQLPVPAGQPCGRHRAVRDRAAIPAGMVHPHHPGIAAGGMRLRHPAARRTAHRAHLLQPDSRRRAACGQRRARRRIVRPAQRVRHQPIGATRHRSRSHAVPRAGDFRLRAGHHVGARAAVSPSRSSWKAATAWRCRFPRWACWCCQG